MQRRLTAIAAAIGILTMAGCAGPANERADDGVVRIVASTNVYGAIAEAIGADRVEVTSILDDPSQDPHSFEASARVQLALSTADVVIENGGGYDDFVDTLLAGSNNPSVVVLNAVELSGYDQGADFNEHVWYDLRTMAKVAEAVAGALETVDPGASAAYAAAADDFVEGLEQLESRTGAIAEEFAGTGVAITEPVPAYLLASLGLVIVSPPEFSEAIEEGTDVSPAVLADTLALFESKTAHLLVYNEQTTGRETEAVLTAAEAAGVPVVSVAETIQDDSDYLEWMEATIDRIERALQ